MTFVRSIEDALDFIKTETGTLRLKGEEENPVIKKLVVYNLKPFDILNYQWQYVNNDGCYTSWSQYRFDDSTASSDRIIARRDGLLAALDQILPSIEPTRLHNIEIIKHNQSVVSRIKTLMKGMGIPDSYSERDTKSRSRNPKYLTMRAGYLGDIARNVPLEDSVYKNTVAKIEGLRKSIDAWGTRLLADIRDREKLEAEEAAKSKAIVALATLRVKYGLALDAATYDIEQAILEKDKYLRLAHYLLKNREDWNDGPHYANIGLSGFSVENDIDHEIYTAINEHIVDWDGDGRIFRDIEWNYDRLFGMADVNVMSDYSAFVEIVPRF